jgi:hypothetical protein
MVIAVERNVFTFHCCSAFLHFTVVRRRRKSFCEMDTEDNRQLPFPLTEKLGCLSSKTSSLLFTDSEENNE